MDLDKFIGDTWQQEIRTWFLGNYFTKIESGSATVRDWVGKIFDGKVTLISNNQIIFDGTLRQLAQEHFVDLAKDLPKGETPSGN